MGSLTCPQILDDRFKICFPVSKDRPISALFPRDPIRVKGNFPFPDSYVNHGSVGLDGAASALDARTFIRHS